MKKNCHKELYADAANTLAGKCKKRCNHRDAEALLCGPINKFSNLPLRVIVSFVQTNKQSSLKTGKATVIFIS